MISHLRWLSPPLVPYGTTFPPRWEACHLILSRLRLPANQVPLPPRSGQGGSHYPSGARLACFPSPARAVVKVLIYNGAEGAVPPQWNGTSYLPRARALNPSGRRQPVPDRTLSAQGQRPGGAINPRPRKTTVGRLNGRPFYEQAKGQLRPTCTSYAGCAHQPSGIRESTAPVPIPTAPQAPEPSSPIGACP